MKQSRSEITTFIEYPVKGRAIEVGGYAPSGYHLISWLSSESEKI
jgi:hypothetical protein